MEVAGRGASAFLAAEVRPTEVMNAWLLGLVCMEIQEGQVHTNACITAVSASELALRLVFVDG